VGGEIPGRADEVGSVDARYPGIDGPHAFDMRRLEWTCDEHDDLVDVHGRNIRSSATTTAVPPTRTSIS